MGTFRMAYMYNREQELPYFYFLGALRFIGSAWYERLQTYFDSPGDFYRTPADKLEKLAIFTPDQLARIDNLRRDRNTLRSFDRLTEQGIRMLPFEDDSYPEQLKEIGDYAPVLFLKGKLPASGTPCVSIIGARECSGYGAAIAKRLGELFAERGAAVISGMARGIDSLSQIAAISAGGYSLAFLGGGVDVIYPRESRRLYDILLETGGIMSEYVPGTEPLRPFFVRRNRLISGMAHVVCVVEAKEKSGTLITVGCALEQGREVFAVPGRINDITSFGTNELIRQGAGIINDLNSFVDDVMKRYGTEETLRPLPGKKKNTFDFLNKNEKIIAELLDENSFTVEQMGVRAGISSFEVLGLCITLAEKGLVSSLGAGRFVATDKGTEIRNSLLSLRGEDGNAGQ